MAVGEVAAHLCLTLIIKELKISVEQDRVVTTLNIIFSVVVVRFWICFACRARLVEFTWMMCFFCSRQGLQNQQNSNSSLAPIYKVTKRVYASPSRANFQSDFRSKVILLCKPGSIFYSMSSH